MNTRKNKLREKACRNHEMIKMKAMTALALIFEHKSIDESTAFACTSLELTALIRTCAVIDAKRKLKYWNNTSKEHGE